jgi:hypothetical protein
MSFLFSPQPAFSPATLSPEYERALLAQTELRKTLCAISTNTAPHAAQRLVALRVELFDGLGKGNEGATPAYLRGVEELAKQFYTPAAPYDANTIHGLLRNALVAYAEARAKVTVAAEAKALDDLPEGSAAPAPTAGAAGTATQVEFAERGKHAAAELPAAKLGGGKRPKPDAEDESDADARKRAAPAKPLAAKPPAAKPGKEKRSSAAQQAASPRTKKEKDAIMAVMAERQQELDFEKLAKSKYAKDSDFWLVGVVVDGDDIYDAAWLDITQGPPDGTTVSP